MRWHEPSICAFNIKPARTKYTAGENTEFVQPTVYSCYGVCLSLVMAQSSDSRDYNKPEQRACNPSTDIHTSAVTPETRGTYLWQGHGKAVKAAE